MDILQVDKLSISFHSRDGVTKAVNNVSFNLEDGKILGIVGESGSGKSVTCYSLLGLLPSPPAKVNAGSAIYRHQDLLKASEAQLRKIRGQKIGLVFQDPMTSLNPYMRIGEQLIEGLRAQQKIGKRAALQEAERALEEVGIEHAKLRLNAFPHEFSGGMRQRVLIAMALICKPEILIADEPTTALDVTVQAQILALLLDIQKRRKLAIIFISHNLSLVERFANSIIVMENGEIVESGSPKEVLSNPQHPYTQKLVAAVPRGRSIKQALPDKTEPLLCVENLHTEYLLNSGFLFWKRSRRIQATNNVSFTINKGEIFGLVGESGSGKSTLGRSITKLVQAKSGVVKFQGRDILKMSLPEWQQTRHHIQMVFQDPYASLNPRMTIFQTLAEPLRINTNTHADKLHAEVNRLLEEVGLHPQFARRYPHEFSGGQRQRIAIARALASKPELIIADEPVSALDVTVQAQILDLLLEVRAQRSLTMLFISHDLAVIRYLCDRIAVMQGGEIVELKENEALFSRPESPYTQKLLSAIH